MATTVVQCRPTMAGVQFQIPLFNVGATDRARLVAHLSTFRPGFDYVECAGDGGIAVQGKPVCLALLPEETDDETVMMAQKALIAALTEFFPNDEIVINDQRVVH